MELSITSKGTRDQVREDVSSQIMNLRRAHEASSPLLASVGDEVFRRMKKAPGTDFEVSVVVMIEIKVPKGAEAKPEDLIEINGKRMTRAEIEQLLNGSSSAGSTPIIGSSAAGGSSLISNDDD